MYSKCNEPLGMENETIPDDHVTPSSVWSEEHGAANGRLHLRGIRRNNTLILSRGWKADKDDKSQWLQVDLGSLVVITQIATQGRVKNYTISYSLDGNDFNTYENGKVLNRV